jgi:hypothetical protein
VCCSRRRSIQNLTLLRITATPAAETLVDRALASGDEHAIKLCEAALRSFGRSGDVVLLLAAADACDRL